MATKRTPAQRAQLKTVNGRKVVLTHKYAYRMHQWLSKWKADGLSQRAIVDALNEAGAPVPSEYDGTDFAPAPIKQWGLTQYQRFDELSTERYQRMLWWHRRRGSKSMPTYGDGAGLFKYPLMVMEYDPNHRRPTIQWGTPEWKEWQAAHPVTEAELARRKVVLDELL